jgi:two-component system, OmpR family, phosphate regulon sensor histidine kinase PhoR
MSSDKSSLLWRFYSSHMAVLLMGLLLFGYFTLIELRELQRYTISESLKKQAQVVGEILGPKLSQHNIQEIDALCDRLTAGTGYRLTVMAPDGSVLGDSESSPSRMEDHATRPEVKAAMAGSIGSSTRYSFTVNTDMVYVAIPIMKDGKLLGVVRVSTPTERLSQILEGFYVKLGAMILFLIVAVGIISLLLANRINKPITEIKDAAERFAKGDLGQIKLPPGGAREIDELAASINDMVAQLHERLDIMTRQKNELESLLAEMVEAVVVVDQKKRIVRMNQAAENILQTVFADAEGRNLLQAVRNTGLNQFVTKTLSSASPIEEELTVIGNQDRILQAHGAQISDTQGKPAGALIVMNDISRLKAIDQIRKDFVANVSHELKTPVTSIKGFLETLKDGAINDRATAERFLDIAIKHTDRLTNIIEDLLKLSRVEQDADLGAMKLESASVCDVVQSVVRFLDTPMREKEVKIVVDCDESIKIMMNRPLFEQALSNLVDNAIKYSSRDSEVSISAKQVDKETIIQVQDRGTGIPSDQLPRIFERFFRVDRGRDRKTGGAGLGLSIARHIVNLHSGKIDVTSGIGQGSVFTIRIPA